MSKHSGRKAALKHIAIGAAVGAGALFVGGFAAQRIAYLNQQPWLVPASLVGVGLLLAMRGRANVGVGLAGAGGALGMLQWQATHAQAAAPAPKPATAGYGDAGRMDSGWYDRPAGAGALMGAASGRLLAQQQSMGFGDAGAFFGAGASRMYDAMGLEGG